MKNSCQKLKAFQISKFEKRKHQNILNLPSISQKPPKIQPFNKKKKNLLPLEKYKCFRKFLVFFKYIFC